MCGILSVVAAVSRAAISGCDDSSLVGPHQNVSRLPRIKGNDTDYVLRFHLHPLVKASRLSDGHGVMLMLPNRQVWTFTAYEDRVELEESVYLAASDGARRTVQIVIYGEARKLARVHWTFAQVERPEAGSRRDAEMEPELPL